MEVDVIEFKVPTENNKTLFVWNLQPTLSEAFIYESLWRVYSGFGALYLLKVCPNAELSTPGFYAMIKFYSAAHAAKAQKITDKQCLFQDCPLKVKLSTKLNPSFLSQTQSLSFSKCIELANYYLGFNGWRTDIITLKDISKCAEDVCNADAGRQGELLKYVCVVKLTLPEHDVQCCGVAVAEDVLEQQKTMENMSGPEERLYKRGRLMKRARDKAVASAFGKVILIVLENGKVAVERRFDPEEILPYEEVDGVIQVNVISWTDLESDGEWEMDLPWDFTVDLP